jgi:hypothetical protein
MITEAQVRKDWMAAQREKLNDWRRDRRADGWPPDVIEKLALRTEEISRENLERALPLLMRDLMITSGDAMSH